MYVGRQLLKLLAVTAPSDFDFQVRSVAEYAWMKMREKQWSNFCVPPFPARCAQKKPRMLKIFFFENLYEFREVDIRKSFTLLTELNDLKWTRHSRDSPIWLCNGPMAYVCSYQRTAAITYPNLPKKRMIWIMYIAKRRVIMNIITEINQSYNKK